jgi:rhodanese-related sulfurtransferase
MNTILYISAISKKVWIGRKYAIFQLLFYNARIEFNHWNLVKFILDHILLVAIAVISGGALLWPALTRAAAATPHAGDPDDEPRQSHGMVDVRSDEFAAGHLRDAKNIPLADLGKRIGELDKSKSKTVIVVCQSGARADKAARQLAKAAASRTSTPGRRHCGLDGCRPAVDQIIGKECYDCPRRSLPPPQLPLLRARRAPAGSQGRDRHRTHPRRPRPGTARHHDAKAPAAAPCRKSTWATPTWAASTTCMRWTRPAAWIPLAEGRTPDPK